MKTIFNLIITAALAGSVLAEAEAPQPNIVVAGKEVAESKPADLVQISRNFEKVLKEASLSPSPSIYAEVKAVQDAATTLLRRQGEENFPRDSDEAKAVSSVVRSVLSKFDSLIEEDYQRHPGMANISPPPGTPNAAAGMSPDAIQDPELRKQYLDAIDKQRTKQEKNSQQQALNSSRGTIIMCIAALNSYRATADFSKEELITQFTDEGKSRELLRQRVAPVKCSGNGASK